MHGGQTSGESGEGSRPYILLTLSAETRAQCDGMPAATLRPDATGTAFERVRGYDGQVTFSEWNEENVFYTAILQWS